MLVDGDGDDAAVSLVVEQAPHHLSSPLRGAESFGTKFETDDAEDVKNVAIVRSIDSD